MLIGCQRIGKEIERIPKAAGGPAKIITRAGKNKSGRGALNIPGTSRARLQKLASLPVDDILATAKQLRDSGNDATVWTVTREIAQGDKKAHRSERELGRRQLKLADKRYGVLYADPPWRFAPYSQTTGMDRAADNHYPTMSTAEIAAMSVPAAKDAVLFLWATVPMLPEALDVMKQWGLTAKPGHVQSP